MEQLFAYCKTYPDLEIQDLLKYIYQSCSGCGHFYADFDNALQQIKTEMVSCESDLLPEIENLDGDYARVHLKYLIHGLSPETLCRLFLLSSKEGPSKNISLSKTLADLTGAAADGKLPFSKTDLDTSLAKWKEAGFQPCHHSDSFKKNWHPSYRVIHKKYIPLLPLLTAIDNFLKNQSSMRVAIDGRAASGKTTLASLLLQIYGCNVFHMDDFFLRPQQRTENRLLIPGENVDHERFLEEVLLPLSMGQTINYQRFDCHTVKFLPNVQIIPGRLTITEGVYCLHPSLSGYYDLKVFLDISPELQRQRILLRNADTADRFFKQWIPMEETYFNTFDIRNQCTLHLEIK